jgi:hypothetical protein
MSCGRRRRCGGEQRKKATHLVLGIGLMVIGSLMILHRLDVFDVGAPYWPLLLVALGLVQMIVPDDEGRRGGVWLFAIGILLQLHLRDIFRFHESWPLLLVAGGIQIVIETLARRQHRVPLEEDCDA